MHALHGNTSAGETPANTKLKMATYNARGAQSAGAFARLVWHLESYGKSHDVHVWLVQEHNLHPGGKIDHNGAARKNDTWHRK